jgi:hypothetical protein
MWPSPPASAPFCIWASGGATRQRCLEALQSLGPNDVQDLDFLEPLQVDDSLLPSIARLTGMTHFCPIDAHFTPKGWSTLAPLPRLEHICTPHGLTDTEMAGIARFPALREMEIVADRLTDAGLASLAKTGAPAAPGAPVIVLNHDAAGMIFVNDLPGGADLFTMVHVNRAD